MQVRSGDARTSGRGDVGRVRFAVDVRLLGPLQVVDTVVTVMAGPACGGEVVHAVPSTRKANAAVEVRQHCVTVASLPVNRAQDACPPLQPPYRPPKFALGGRSPQSAGAFDGDYRAELGSVDPSSRSRSKVKMPVRCESGANSKLTA